MMTGHQIDIDTWNNRLREISVSVAELIPEVGGLVSGVLDVFWPKDSKSIWELIREQTAELIDIKILKKEEEERKGDIVGLKLSMEQYSYAKIREKKLFMVSMLTQANTIFGKFSESTNAMHLLPLSMTAAQMHMAILYERYVHGKKLFGEDNSKEWEDELCFAFEKYSLFFKAQYPKWKKWRLKKITAKWYTTKPFILVPPFFRWDAHGEASDSMTRQKVSYLDQFNSNENTFKKVSKKAKKRYESEAIAKMASALSPIHDFNVFLADKHIKESKQISDEFNQLVHQGVLSELKSVWLGPYSSATMGEGSRVRPYDTNVDDKCGYVKEVYIREYNSIDGLQFIYDDHEGHFIGNKKGGEPHHFKLSKTKWVNGFDIKFGNGILSQINLMFSDGKNTGKLGNRSHWSGPEARVLMGNSMALSCGKFKQSNGPSGTVGTGVLCLKFSHVPVTKHN